MRTVLALALALAILLPTAGAHLDRDRPHIQVSEETRRITTALSGNALTIQAHRTVDPFEDLVTHTIDPSRWSMATEYRAQPSDAASAFSARWEITRLVEYRDLNSDARFEARSDTVVRSWRFDRYAWDHTEPAEVQVATALAQDVLWRGNLSGAPDVSIEADAAGTAFQDEGARVRSQDVVLYVDMSGFPPRGVGDLYVLEGVATASAGGIEADPVDAAIAENALAGLVARAPSRLAGLDWGAQATLDKAERNLNLTLDPAEGGSRAFRIDLPIFDKTLHMVFVSWIEYTKEAPRVVPGVPLALALALALAVAGRRGLAR